MRYQKAKRLIPILEMLNSDDKEVVLLGIMMLANEPIIVNLNKHYKKAVKASYPPAFEKHKPKKFIGFGPVVIFSKALFTDIFNEVDKDYLFNLTTLTIISWVYQQLNLKSKNRKLPKYKFQSYRGITKHIYNRDYTPVINKFYYKNEIGDHAQDTSKDARACVLFETRKHSKRPQRVKRKYNTCSSDDFDILISKLDLKKYPKWDGSLNTK